MKNRAPFCLGEEIRHHLMRVSKIDRSWIGEMTRAFEADRTACAEFWVPEKTRIWEKSSMWLGLKYMVRNTQG